jgi:hypothetical protein
MTPLKVTLALIVSGFLFVVIYYFIDKWTDRRRAREYEYNYRYSLIQYRIDFDNHTSGNYESLMRAITCLSELPYKNKEKTSVLFNDFMIKWKAEKTIKTNEELRRISEKELTL